jgi:hypothetical protein
MRKITQMLSIAAIAAGAVLLAAPAGAQSRGNHGGGGQGNHGGGNHGGGGQGNHGGNYHYGDHYRGYPRYYNGGRVNFYFGGYGYPYFYGYPYYAYPYYGYGYPYGYPVNAYYSYDPQGVYQGRLATPPQSTNDGGGKDVSMAKRVQRQLASAGYYHGAIDGVLGEGTRRAIRNYERDNGLVVDGRIDDRLIATMSNG